MATETAAYAQFKEQAERFVGAQSNVVCDHQKSDREIAHETLAAFFEFVEADEIDRLRMELTTANTIIADQAQIVNRLTNDLNTATNQRDEFKRQIEKFEQL
jgi:hypothetical protein